MYERFFGLTRKPFLMSADPHFLFLTPQHREALTGLTYVVRARKGFAVLTGDAGTGKTTVLKATLGWMAPDEVKTAFVSVPTLTPSEFLELAMFQLGISEVSMSKAQRLIRLERFLVNAHQSNRPVVLVIDEAHKLSPEVLEEVRLLTNLETDDGKLMQIILAAQNELDDLLRQERMRQLKQRVAYRFSVRALSSEEVGHYIAHRWRKAGGASQPPFTGEALSLIATYSRGIPRLVNGISDNALVTAFAEGARMIKKDNVVEAARDLDLLDVRAEGAEAAVRTAKPEERPETTLSFHATTEPAVLPTLERYDGRRGGQSWFMRSARKLGFVH